MYDAYAITETVKFYENLATWDQEGLLLFFEVLQINLAAFFGHDKETSKYYIICPRQY